MLVYRKLDDFELKYNREFLKHYVAKKSILLMAKLTLDILELIILICFFHVKCLLICIPQNLADSSYHPFQYD